MMANSPTGFARLFCRQLICNIISEGNRRRSIRRSGTESTAESIHRTPPRMQQIQHHITLKAKRASDQVHPWHTGRADRTEPPVLQ